MEIRPVEQLSLPGRKGRSRPTAVSARAVAGNSGVHSTMRSGNTRLPRCGVRAPLRVRGPASCRAHGLPTLVELKFPKARGSRADDPASRRADERIPSPRYSSRVPAPCAQNCYTSCRFRPRSARAVREPFSNNAVRTTFLSVRRATRSGLLRKTCTDARRHRETSDRNHSSSSPQGKPPGIHDRPRPDPGTPAPRHAGPLGSLVTEVVREEPTDQWDRQVDNPPLRPERGGGGHRI